MKILSYLCVLCCFIACNDGASSSVNPPVTSSAITSTTIPSPKVEDSTSTRPTSTLNDSLKTSATLTIKDSTLYDSQFLKDLAASNFATTFVLKDEVLLMDQDSTTFPTDLVGPPSQRFGKKYYFKGEKKGQTYQLTISPLNYTSLDYDFKLMNGKDVIRKRKGQVHLSAFFFLGDETDTDDETDSSYLASEYAQESEGCYFSIRIGRDEGDLKAKIIWTCEGDELKNIELEDGPTLREG